MSLYYVMVALVIEGEDAGHAEGVAESLVDAVLQIRPPRLAGSTLVKAIESTPASNDWFDKDQILRDGKIVEEELS